MRNVMQAAFAKGLHNKPIIIDSLEHRCVSSLERAFCRESRFVRKPFTTNLSFRTYNQLKSQGIVS